jgi:hypothetical protein
VTQLKIRPCCGAPYTQPHYDGCDVEALRVNRWHATRDAVLVGCSDTREWGVDECLEWSSKIADRAHGPLEFKP